MALDQDELQQALSAHPNAMPAVPQGEMIEALLSHPGAQNWLQRRAQVDPSGGVIGQMRTLGISPYLTALHGEAQAIPAGAQQESQRILQKPPIKTLQEYFAKGGLTPQQQQLVQQYPQQARAGRGLTDVAGYAGAAALAPETLPWQMGAGAVAGGMIAPKGHAVAGTIAGGLLPGTAKALKLAPEAWKFLRGLSPGKYAKSMVENLPATRNAENVLNNLGQGRTPEENSTNLATKVKDAKKAVGKYFSNEYNDLIKRAGPESIYDESRPAAKGSYRILKDWEKSPIDTYLSSAKAAHKDFTSIPTFGNAHKLQSVLGDEARQVFKNPLSNLQDKATAQGWEEAQKKLLNDMDSHLKNVDRTGVLSAEYKDIGEKYLHNVVPYKNKYITKVATGKVTNPRNLSTIFKNPESDIKKVVGDLGPQARDQIVFNELYHRKPTAKNIINNYSKLEEKGLQSYVSPKLEQQVSGLKGTHAQDEFLKYIGNNPTAKNIVKAGDQLEKQGLLHQLNPSLQEQLNILKGKYTRAKWAKRGAGILGAGYLAKKLLPSHLAQQLIP